MPIGREFSLKLPRCDSVSVGNVGDDPIDTHNVGVFINQCIEPAPKFWGQLSGIIVAIKLAKHRPGIRVTRVGEFGISHARHLSRLRVGAG